MKYLLMMTLVLSDGLVAEQPASMLDCDAVQEALATGAVVKIDGSDGRTHTVIASACAYQWTVDGCDCQEPTQ